MALRGKNRTEYDGCMVDVPSLFQFPITIQRQLGMIAGLCQISPIEMDLADSQPRSCRVPGPICTQILLQKLYQQGIRTVEPTLAGVAARNIGPRQSNSLRISTLHRLGDTL